MTSPPNIIRTLLQAWRGKDHEPLESAPEFWRRTLPDATMNLLLRFETESGPRTIVAPRIPLKVASQLADTMIAAGHYAQVVDAYPVLTVAQRIAQIEANRTPAARPCRTLSAA